MNRVRITGRPLLTLAAAAMLSGCTPDEQKSMVIEVMGEAHQWTARYPGPDGALHTLDDVVSPGVITVPVGVLVTLQLRSKDFVYLFALPEFGVKEIAVPDLEFQVELLAGSPGDFEILGGDLCGRPQENHGKLLAKTQSAFSLCNASP